jgi:perosamine synthetase
MPKIFRFWHANIWRPLMLSGVPENKLELETPWRPYGRQTIDEDDIQAVVKVLRSDWLTTGPEIPAFESEFAAAVGARFAVAVNSGTAALHAAMNACGIGPGDEVLVPAMTFAASANCVVYQGGTPVFVDVDPDTLLINIDDAETKISSRTRAIIAVDYAGQPCDYDHLREFTREHKLTLIADACHSLGGSYHGRSVGSLADLNVFSLHPVKPITTGEGGVITTDDEALAKQMRIFRNHGITTDHHQRQQGGDWCYDMVSLGFNYRLTDMQAALGRSQLRKLKMWSKKRRELADIYNEYLRNISSVQSLKVLPEIEHAYHLYVIKTETAELRAHLFKEMRDRRIGVTVHYQPVHLHPYYREHLGTCPGMCPVAEDASLRILSLPIYPTMNKNDVKDVVSILTQCVNSYDEVEMIKS